MTSRPPLWAPMLFAMLLSSVPAQGADQCTAAFLFPVQSHATPGVLSMTNESKIISSTVGTRYPFLGKSIQPNANCNSGGYWDGGTWVSNCNVMQWRHLPRSRGLQKCVVGRQQLRGDPHIGANLSL